MPDATTPPDVTQLTMSPETLEALRKTAARQNISPSDGLQQAIRLSQLLAEAGGDADTHLLLKKGSRVQELKLLPANRAGEQEHRMNDSLQPSSISNAANVEFHLSENSSAAAPDRQYALVPYNPQQEYDYVRMIVTVGLLALFGFVIVWVALKSSGAENVWKQTEDMLQIILPALTALIGSVLGFYFGTQKGNAK